MNGIDSYMRARDYSVDLHSNNNNNNNSNSEDWITKKRVETVTKKNLERQIQRQVVLDDGRVIVEDVPEVTVDTVEDRQSHEEDGDEDKKIGFEGYNSYNDRGGTVLGEKFQTNIHTHDVSKRSTTTAAAQNLGELSTGDVDKVVQQGRDVKSLVRAYEGAKENALVIPARIMDQNSSHDRTVDKEDIREVNRVHNGRVMTDRFVTKERILDTSKATPDDGSSTEEESYDADAQGYSQRKEDRYIDYYKVPKGKPVSEGKFLRHGIHLSSHDKDSRKIDPWSTRSRHRALMYDDQSDSTNLSDNKPPRPSRGRRGSDHRSLGYPPAPPPPPPLSSGRYHTIERSQRINRSKASDRRSMVSSSGHSQSSKHLDQSHNRSRHSDSDRSYRSRSMSRSSADNLYDARSQPRSSSGAPTASMRSDLDSDRAGRLRRAMSFTSTKSNGNPSKVSSSKTTESKSLLGSVKSLYATITRGNKKNKNNKDKDTNSGGFAPKEWFASSKARRGINPPSAPPRKHRSTSQLGGSTSHISDVSAGNRSWNAYNGNHSNTSSLKRSRPNSYHPASSAPRSGGIMRGGSNYHNQQQQHHTTSTVNISSNDHMTNYSSDPKRRSSRVERRKTISSYDDLMENRDPPRFEDYRNRHSRPGSSLSGNGGRFFGQPSGEDESDEHEDRRRTRPAPDMRRLLLNNVNVSRRKSMSKDPEEKPRVDMRTVY